MYGYHVEKMNMHQKDAIRDFLSHQNLEFEESVEETLVLWHGDNIIGSCSSDGAVIKMFAIQKCYRQNGVSTILLTHMINNLFDKGFYTVLAYTPSENKATFESLQFKCVYDTGRVALMQVGIDGIKQDLLRLQKSLEAQVNMSVDQVQRAAIVMNGNPFTKGHLFLIEKAAQENQEVVVFVVEEDRSSFPTHTRLKLIQEGTKHLNNVKVVKGGLFIVSSATFPQYFERDKSKRAQWGAELDAGIFCSHFAKGLNICKRYVGTEPFCETTRIYNQVLMKTCEANDIELIEVNRLKSESLEVSASMVRSLLRYGDLEVVKSLVPKCTVEFLKTDDAGKIIERIMSANGSKH